MSVQSATKTTMTRLADDVRVVAVRQYSEPAGFDWTAAGARTLTLMMRNSASLPGDNGFTYGVIAPDPSPNITETPNCGMNSPYCLDGIQGNDELLRRGTRSTPARIERLESWRIAIRNPCHSLDGVRAARGRPSNRCLVHHPGSTWTCCNRNVKRSRNQQPM